MIATIQSRLIDIQKAINLAKEECDFETVFYYIGQRDLCNSLLSSDEDPYMEEYYQDDYYMSHFDDSYHVDPLELYLHELKGDIQDEIDSMYNKYSHFSSQLGKNVMNIDSHWFTSDEVEVFRVIWQRRISTITNKK